MLTARVSSFLPQDEVVTVRSVCQWPPLHGASGEWSGEALLHPRFCEGGSLL